MAELTKVRQDLAFTMALDTTVLTSETLTATKSMLSIAGTCRHRVLSSHSFKRKVTGLRSRMTLI